MTIKKLFKKLFIKKTIIDSHRVDGIRPPQQWYFDRMPKAAVRAMDRAILEIFSNGFSS